MSESRSSENDLGGLERKQVGTGGCVPEGIEEKTVAGTRFEIHARPDREGPAPSTWNPEKAPGVPGSRT